MLLAHFPMQHQGSELSRYSLDPNRWAEVRLEKQGSHWLLSLQERELTSSQKEHLRAAAYDRLRCDGFIPAALIDLVEHYRESVPVRLMLRKETEGLRLLAKAATKMSADVLPASEALSLLLRIMLRELRDAKKKRKAAPARIGNLVPQSIIAEVAYDLLEACAADATPPGLLLCALLRELLNVDHHPEAVADVSAQESVAFVIAQNPSIKTRELHRRFDIDPGTISRWRRSVSFKKRVERCAAFIRQRAKRKQWPPA